MAGPDKLLAVCQAGGSITTEPLHDMEPHQAPETQRSGLGEYVEQQRASERVVLFLTWRCWKQHGGSSASVLSGCPREVAQQSSPKRQAATAALAEGRLGTMKPGWPAP